MNPRRRLARLEAGPLGAPQRETREFADLTMARGAELRRLRAAGLGEPYETMRDWDLFAEWGGRRVPLDHLREIVRRYEEPSDDVEREALRWVSRDEIEAVAAALNARPRKTLGWKTPAEALDEHLRSLQQAGVATTT